MELKHESTKLRMMCHCELILRDEKKGGLNANISQYLVAIKYTTEAYICAKIAYYVRNQLNNCNILENK